MKWNEKFKVFVKEFMKGLRILVLYLIGSILIAMFWSEMVKAMTDLGASWIIFWAIMIIGIIIGSVITALIETHKKCKTES